MAQGISRKIHGLADAGYIPLAFLAPKIFGFANDKKASVLCKAISMGTLAYSLLTKAEWGAAKVIPYKAHTAIDMSVGAGAIAAPFALGITNKSARNTLIALGVTSLVVGFISFLGSRK